MSIIICIVLLEGPARKAEEGVVVKIRMVDFDDNTQDDNYRWQLWGLVMTEIIFNLSVGNDKDDIWLQQCWWQRWRVWPVLECCDVDWSDCPHIDCELEWVLWYLWSQGQHHLYDHPRSQRISGRIRSWFNWPTAHPLPLTKTRMDLRKGGTPERIIMWG